MTPKGFLIRQDDLSSEAAQHLVRLHLEGVHANSPRGHVFAVDDPPSTSERREATAMYLVIYRPGPAWIPGKSISEQSLGNHARYMMSLYNTGQLKFAGPFTDDTGGAVALEAKDLIAARALMAADPAVVEGIFVGEVHPWRLLDWSAISKDSGSHRSGSNP